MKGEPEPRKGNVNTVYFINQARANTRISCTEFIYDESMLLNVFCKNLVVDENFLILAMERG